MANDVAVQLGMFGVSNSIAGAHVVQAHTRVLSNGEEVFVGEHLRWNRGRGGPRSTAKPSSPGDATSQQDLFGPRG